MALDLKTISRLTQPYSLIGNYYEGIVVNNVDPKNCNRVQVKVQALTKKDKDDPNLGKDVLPWYSILQVTGQGNNSGTNIPAVESRVIVIFPTDDIYNGLVVGQIASVAPGGATSGGSGGGNNGGQGGETSPAVGGDAGSDQFAAKPLDANNENQTPDTSDAKKKGSSDSKVKLPETEEEITAEIDKHGTYATLERTEVNEYGAFGKYTVYSKDKNGKIIKKEYLTCERANEGYERGKNLRIPEGEYQAKAGNGKKYPGYTVLGNDKVGFDSGITIHGGNRQEHSQGCVLIGGSYTRDKNGKITGIANSKAAVKDYNAFTGKSNGSPTQPKKVYVKNNF